MARSARWPVIPLMRAYHDEEWGYPLHDDRKLFEFLILDGAQAGLSAGGPSSNRREGYRKAFHRFNAKRIAAYGPKRCPPAAWGPGHYPQPRQG